MTANLLLAHRAKVVLVHADRGQGNPLESRPPSDEKADGPEGTKPAESARAAGSNARLRVGNTEVTGIVSRSDILAALVRYGPDLFRIRVRDIMRRPVVVAGPDVGCAEALAIMDRLGIDTLPIAHCGLLDGILTRDELLREHLCQLASENRVLRDRLAMSVPLGVAPRRLAG